MDLERIDFEAEDLQVPVAEFDSAAASPQNRIAKLRRSTSEQALHYRDNRDRILDQNAGRFIFLHDGKVIWSGARPEEAGEVRQAATRTGDRAVWLKLADPEEREGERMEVYEKILA